MTDDTAASKTDVHRCDVVVVGAGVTGLTAADALARSGAHVLVLEARDRVGGRAYSLPAGAGAIDLGASWFWPNEPATRALCDDLGVGTFSQHERGDAILENRPDDSLRLDGNPVDVPSSRFVHGAQSLAERLARRLDQGTVLLDEPVAAITVVPDGVLVDGRTVRALASHVVVAMPPQLAAACIDFMPRLPRALRATAETTSVWMGSTVKAVAVYGHAFWRQQQLSGSAVSYVGPFREFHDHSGPDAAPAAVFGFAPSAAFRPASTHDIESAFVDQLTRLLGPPAAHPLEVHAVDWSRERHTVPEATQQAATSALFGAPEYQVPVHRRIHLASTETATAYAGHLEGAVRAGLETSRRVLRLMCP